MKRMIVLTVMGLLAATTIANAQRGNRNVNQAPMAFQNQCMIPNLTDDQQQKIDELRTAHWNEVKEMRADLGILRAELRKLQMANNADVNAMNAKVDKMGALKIKMQKTQIKHLTDVKSLLTDEQKAWFDTRAGRRGGQSGFNNGRGGRGTCDFNGNMGNGRRGGGYGNGGGMQMRY